MRGRLFHLARSSNLLHYELYLVQIDVVRRLIAISIKLIIDSHAMPRSRSRISVDVQGGGFSVQGDGLKQQAVAGCPLHLNGQVVPRAALWIA